MFPNYDTVTKRRSAAVGQGPLRHGGRGMLRMPRGIFGAGDAAPAAPWLLQGGGEVAVEVLISPEPRAPGARIEEAAEGHKEERQGKQQPESQGRGPRPPVGPLHDLLYPLRRQHVGVPAKKKKTAHIRCQCNHSTPAHMASGDYQLVRDTCSRAGCR